MIVMTMLVALLVWDGEQNISSAELQLVLRVRKENERTCGPLSAWYCLRKQGRDVAEADVLDQVDIGVGGVSLLEVQGLLGKNGIATRIVSFTSKDVMRLPAPTILVFGGSHCVVYDGIDDNTDKAKVYEPSQRRLLRIPTRLVENMWSGEALLFSEPAMPTFAFWCSAAAAAGVTVLGIPISGQWIASKRWRN